MFIDRIDHLFGALSANPELIKRGIRLDASNTIYLKRELQAVEARIYRKRYPDLVWRKLLPIQSDQGRGPKTFSYSFTDYKGNAAFAEPGTDGLPTVSLTKDEVIGKYRSFGDKFFYSWDELDAANFSGFALSAELGMAAREAWERLANTTTHRGHAALQLDGFISDLSKLTAYTIPASGSGNSDALKKKWANKTGALIFADLMGMITQTGKTTLNAFKSNALALPVDQSYLMMERKMSEYDQRTVFEAFSQAYDEIAKKMGLPDLRLTVDPDLAGAGPDGTDLILAYPYDEEVAAIKLPMDFTMFSMVPTEDGNFSVPCWGRTGGVVLRHGKAITYGAGI
jgi:hypothetical protein